MSFARKFGNAQTPRFERNSRRIEAIIIIIITNNNNNNDDKNSGKYLLVLISETNDFTIESGMNFRRDKREMKNEAS